MKWTKLIKASLTPEQISFAKTLLPGYSADDFEFAIDMKNEIQKELEYEFEDKSLEVSDEDFKNITGLSIEEMDKKLELNHKNSIIEDFKDYKDMDISALENLLEGDELNLSFTNNKIRELIQELQNLKHDGSADLGYLKNHSLDRKHTRML